MACPDIVMTTWGSLSEMVVVGPREHQPPQPELGGWLKRDVGLMSSCEGHSGSQQPSVLVDGTFDMVDEICC